MVKYLKVINGEIMIRWNLTKLNLPILIDKLRTLDLSKNWRVNISEHKYIRSISQNDRYWLMLKELGSYLGYTDIELHDLLKYKFLAEQKEIAGQPVIVIKSTSSLNTEEFSEYNRNVERFAHEYGFKFNNDIPQY
jgi:hypothetical protein